MIENLYLNSLSIYKITDFIEIIFFSSFIYFISLWLKHDTQKNILAIFYTLISACIVANFCNMITISNFIILFTPGFLMILFLIHQNTLQKNFIALKKISPATKNENSWLDDFFRSCLNSMANNKQVTVIIESTESIQEFIKSEFNINAPINQDLTNILINSSSFDQNKMIYISSNGTLNSINCLWNMQNNDLLFTTNNSTLNEWQQDSIIFSSKINCLIFKTYPAKRTLDIVLQGKLIENITPQNALNIITQYIKKNEFKNLNKDKDFNEIKSKNVWSKQHSS